MVINIKMELNKMDFFRNKKHKNEQRKTFHEKKAFSYEREWFYKYFQKVLTLK